MKKRDKWIKIELNILNSNKKNKLICPECGANHIKYQYVGDEKTRIGYLAIWCANCLQGINISRVRVPENENLVSFDSEKISNIIPKFKLIR
ncbi:hypothetical protein U472_08295 [Orenia metallireducens]|jgi:late competence protein required for DNA uptake (superfamily II DNA/RNA helicase)|uniref:Uncharacterized protein n=1 Tax=Orenia metallireducens TaxID=1413210 RepID=A0A1C0A722_9FIRM|nr:hypothetical protein [Orenia metallireducens]OCL26014.1 hypothetical protein U472_08295 [Orenia metallireducens]